MSQQLRDIANDRLLMEVARKRIEQVLIDMRAARTVALFRGSGLVIKDEDGSESSLIRFGPEVAMRIGLLAIADYLDAKNSPANL